MGFERGKGSRGGEEEEGILVGCMVGYWGCVFVRRWSREGRMWNQGKG